MDSRSCLREPAERVVGQGLGVVDHDVDAPPLFDRGGDHPVDRGPVLDVALQGQPAPPRWRTSSATASSLAGVRPTSATAAPSPARASATPRPIPWPAPVTMATLPSRRALILAGSDLDGRPMTASANPPNSSLTSLRDFPRTAMTSRSTPSAAICSACSTVRAPPTVNSMASGSRPIRAASSRTEPITRRRVSCRSRPGPTNGK